MSWKSTCSPVFEGETSWSLEYVDFKIWPEEAPNLAQSLVVDYGAHALQMLRVRFPIVTTHWVHPKVCRCSPSEIPQLRSTPVQMITVSRGQACCPVKNNADVYWSMSNLSAKQIYIPILLDEGLINLVTKDMHEARKHAINAESDVLQYLLCCTWGT